MKRNRTIINKGIPFSFFFFFSSGSYYLPKMTKMQEPESSHLAGDFFPCDSFKARTRI